MLKSPRLTALAIFLSIALLGGVITLIGPVQITISRGGSTTPVAAAPMGDLPTLTPLPPTATPPNPAPSDTPAPPTATQPGPAPSVTPAPPTDTPPGPAPSATPRRHTQTDPTDTPEPPAPTPVEATPPAEGTPTPDVVIQKQVDKTTATSGDTLVFTLTARNQGAATASDVVVSDNVPSAFKVTDLFSSKGDIVVEGQTVTAYPRTLAPGEEVTIRITVKVLEGAAGEIGNVAIITTSTPGDDPSNNTSTVTVTVRKPPARTPPTRTPVEQPPTSLPPTADPEIQTFIGRYWPLLTLIVFLFMMGLLIRSGYLPSLRPQRVTITLGGALPAPGPARNEAPVLEAALDLDGEALYQRWRTGTAIPALVQELTREYPAVEPLLISMTVQKLIDEQLAR